MKNRFPIVDNFGPVLYSRGVKERRARFRILWGGLEKPELQCDDAHQIVTNLLTQWGHFSLFQIQFEIPVQDSSRRIQYSIHKDKHYLVVPSAGLPLHIAYTSCNGKASDQPGMRLPENRNALWADLMRSHQQDPFHLLIQGGDQIYADSIFDLIAELAHWNRLPYEEQIRYTVSDTLSQLAFEYYCNCYLYFWSQQHLREALASIPSLCMWDDHDIFDGWGSWSEELQACEVYQCLFQEARRAYFLFQRGEVAPEAHNHCAFSLQFGDVRIIAPDLRSERSQTQVMGQTGLHWLNNALKEFREETKDLIFLSSVPLATSHFSALDTLLTGFPRTIANWFPRKLNPKQYADDVRDQWRVPEHRKEWLRLLEKLLKYSRENQINITILSGEIHLGARSTIKQEETCMHQYIASGIAHEPAPSFVTWCCEWLSKGTQDFARDIDIRMEPIFNKGSLRYIKQRNWLSLAIEPDANRAEWHIENSENVAHSREKLK